VAVTNALAYFNTGLIIALKDFMVEVPDDVSTVAAGGKYRQKTNTTEVGSKFESLSKFKITISLSTCLKTKHKLSKLSQIKNTVKKYKI
jgi:hypothetical protein